MSCEEEVLEFLSNQTAGKYFTVEQINAGMDSDFSIEETEEACEQLASVNSIKKRNPSLGGKNQAPIYRKISP